MFCGMGPKRLRTTLLVAMSVTMVASCNLCERTKPCLGWVQLDETYTVELVQHLELIDVYSSTLDSCGEGLDLRVGGSVRLSDLKKNENLQDDQCDSSCYYVDAQPSIEGARIVRKEGPLQGWDRLQAGGEAELSAACRGSFALSVMEVPPYLNDARVGIASDHILLRVFRTADPGACFAGGEVPAQTDGKCWDVWAVRIRDSSGRLVTKDLALPRAGDAGHASDATDAVP